MSLSVIIPTNRNDALLKTCLESLSAAEPQPHEIIIAADGFDAGDILMPPGRNWKTISLPVCRGPAHARNEAAKQATGKYLLFIDSDVVAPPDICCLIENGFRRFPEADAVFGSYDSCTPVKDWVSQYKNLLHHFTHQNAKEEAFTFWSGCGAVSRDLFLSVGGFDPSYSEPMVEDIELGYRIRQAGGRIFIDKKLLVTHLKRWTFPELVKTDFFKRGLPWSRLLLSNRSFENDMNISIASRLSAIICWLFALFLPSLAMDWRVFKILVLLAAVFFSSTGHSLLFFSVRGVLSLLSRLPFSIPSIISSAAALLRSR